MARSPAIAGACAASASCWRENTAPGSCSRPSSPQMKWQPDSRLERVMKIWAGAVVAAIVGLATQASAQSGDPARGQRVFNQQCRACHTLEKDGAQTAGPNLHGVFGRKAGSAAG